MYNGYLIKIGSTTLPMKYISAEGYEAYTKRRLDISAERNSLGGLIRDVAQNMPSSVTVKLLPMTNTEWSLIGDILHNAYNPVAERKLTVTFYSPEYDDYFTESMYNSDIKFQIDLVDGNTVNYADIELDFIGY